MSHKDYLAGLKDFWSGRPRTAIEHISKVIADSPSNEALLPSYRLWIELLATEQDGPALRSLAEHLRQRSENEKEYANTYFAFRGIIDFELDEIQSAELKIAALKSVNNMYAWELAYKLSHRCGYKVESYPTKKAKEAAAFDYIFSRSYIMHLYQNRMFDQSTDIAKIVDQNFSGNPLIAEIRLHQNIEKGEFGAALRYAHELYDKFPGHSDFPVILAYLQIQNHQLAEAENILSKCESMFGNDDVDVAGLKAVLLSKKYHSSQNKKDKEKSIVAIKRASQLLEQNGYSRLQLSQMYHEEVNTMNNNENEAKTWMVHLSQREFADLMIKDEEEIQTIHQSIGASADVGDLVFMVAHDAVTPKDEESQFRLGAVYQVVSESVWHPIDGDQAVLKLLSKPTISIKLPVLLEENESKYRDKRFVFEMDDNAFAQVYSTIEGYANDETTVLTLKNELEKIRQVS